MIATWKKNKEAASCFIQEHYSDILRQEGFVSYLDEGFSWYKVSNGLLYTIHMMTHSPRQFDVEFHYGIHPLFSWEHIAFILPRRDWPGYFDEPEHGVSYASLYGLTMAKMVLGELPRPFRRYQSTMCVYQQGVLLCYWNTDKKGAEIFDEVIFPIFHRIDSIEKVYDLHKTFRLMQITENTSASPRISFLSEEKYMEGKMICGNQVYKYQLSIAFADECLYMEDRKWFHCIREFLQERVPNVNTIDQRFPPYKTKKGREEVAFMFEHSKKLIQYIDSGDRAILEEALSENRRAMIEQLKEKLPGIDLTSIELKSTPMFERYSREPFRM